LAVVKNEIADEFLKELCSDENGTNASIIGEVTKQYAGKVILKSRIGGSRVVNYLTGEQLPRIC
jgi:hydrogenase expression/formation protein HypE